MGFQYTNNLSRHGTYGVRSPYFTYGIETITGYFPAASFERNLLSGGSASHYPAGNFFAPDFNTIFAGIANADYRLHSGSPFRLAGTDGRDLGAEMGTVMALLGTATPSMPAVPSAPQNLRIGTR